MQTIPPDLGEQTVFGRLGLWLVGVLAAIFWAVYRAWQSRSARLDVRLDTMEAETATKATEVNLSRTEADVRQLFADLASMRTETLGVMATNKDELKDLMHKQTLELMAAINRQPR